MLHSLTQNRGVQLFLLLNIWYVINIFEILDLNVFVVHLELIVSQVSVNSPNGLRAYGRSFKQRFLGVLLLLSHV